MATSGWAGAAARLSERVGRGSVRGLEEFGFGASLLGESVYWLLLGRRNRQPVRFPAVFARAREIGIAAIPIVSVLTATIGVMIAIQGIHTLEPFGAQAQVVIGIAFSVTREFAPLITGILVAGRSGSALAARLGTMTISQEIDALRVIGINPIRFLVVPELLAMLVMLPALTVWADAVALTAGGLYVSGALGMSLAAYFDRSFEVLAAEDVLHGVYKSLIFAALITLVGVVNGSSVRGGAEGVGRVTTRSVVHAISAIVIADMIFVFLSTRT
jgi:phospholipid/cholesterol/gamma-HCH transport system permease protein